jgi:CTP:molybdopterin cytidylyltransferase MocA
MVAGIVLAAGAATRFGEAKQLALFRGRPLIEWPLAALLASPVDETIVVLGAHVEEIRGQAHLDGARIVICEAWSDGLARSLATGLDAAADAEAVVVVLGDQPLLESEAIRRVLAARRPETVAVRATYHGRPGHPVVLERAVWDAVRAQSGDQGAARALSGRAVCLVACDDAGSDVDIDTPAALAGRSADVPIGAVVDANAASSVKPASSGQAGS